MEYLATFVGGIVCGAVIVFLVVKNNTARAIEALQSKEKK